MKRILITLSLLIAATAAFFLFKKNLNRTAETGSFDFALKKPAAITKIHYSSNNKNLGYLTFTKEADGNWWVDNGKKKFKADTSSLRDLLYYVMAKIEIKTPVNDASLDNVNRDLALNATKAQFYEGNELVLEFYAGGRTADDLGTYMYLPKHDRPCITQITGHDGYLTPFFNTDIQNWRSPVIFEAPASQIRSLQVLWNENPNESFTIQQNGEELTLTSSKGNILTSSRNRLLAYLDMFVSITREGGPPAGINNTPQRDTILSGVPFFECKAVLQNGKTQHLKLYRRKISMESYSPETKIGELKVYETETFWGASGVEKEIWLLQDAILHKNLKTLSQLTAS